ncbi:MAG: 1-acyl-sn-glycerol-3-phosphate acyltransferase [Myxococcales bacterium]|nr:1-acyl-sn-glycerol-3-phosphate acyltransferase [Myxococcales bacterium]
MGSSRAAALWRPIRSAVNFAFGIVWTLLCYVIVSLALLVPSRGWLSNFLVRVFWVRGFFAFCRIRLRSSGLENLPRGPCIMMCNHQSHIDILAIFGSNPVNLRFVAKKELFYIPFFGWYLWYAGYIPIDRGHREKAIRSLDRAADKIRRGISIVTFPEGTRSPDGNIQAFKKGPFMLALKSGVPVVPVAIYGSRDILPKKSLAIRPGTIRVRYGPPVLPQGTSNEERDRLMAEIDRRIREQFESLKANQTKGA